MRQHAAVGSAGLEAARGGWMANLASDALEELLLVAFCALRKSN